MRRRVGAHVLDDIESGSGQRVAGGYGYGRIGRAMEEEDRRPQFLRARQAIHPFPINTETPAGQRFAALYEAVRNAQLRAAEVEHGLEIQHGRVQDHAVDLGGQFGFVEKVRHDGAAHAIAHQDQRLGAALQGVAGGPFQIPPFRQPEPHEAVGIGRGPFVVPIGDDQYGKAQRAPDGQRAQRLFPVAVLAMHENQPPAGIAFHMPCGEGSGFRGVGYVGKGDAVSRQRRTAVRVAGKTHPVARVNASGYGLEGAHRSSVAQFRDGVDPGPSSGTHQAEHAVAPPVFRICGPVRCARRLVRYAQGNAPVADALHHQIHVRFFMVGYQGAVPNQARYVPTNDPEQNGRSRYERAQDKAPFPYA